MTVPKTLGLETEYGIVHRGAPEPNPISASSLLINAYLISSEQAPGARAADDGDGVAAETPAARGRAAVGWDFTDETPGNDARGGAAPGSLAPEIETHLVNAVLTNGAPLLRGPRPPRDVLARVRRRPLRGALRPGRRADRRPLHGGGPDAAPAGRGDRGLQEQLRRQGQQLRLPRELPHQPGCAVLAHRRPRHRPFHHPPDLHRGREGGLRGVRDAPGRGRLPAHPAGPTSSRRRSDSRPPSSDPSSTPATSPTPTPPSTGACT